MNEITELRNAITAFGDAMVKEFSIISERLSLAIQEAHDILWQAYLDAGAPFGETEEGLSRWLERMR